MPTAISTILDEFCDRINVPRPSSYVGSTQTDARQYLSLFNFIGTELRKRPYQWPQMKRQRIFLTQTNVRNYPYPGDFYRLLESTPFDASNQMSMKGPISDFQYAVRTQSIVSLQTRKAYRIIGKTSGIIHSRVINELEYNSDGFFEIDPPGASEVDLLSLGYLSKNWILPAVWLANTPYTTAAPDYVNVNGNVYKCIANGTSSATFPPTAVNNIGTDGGTLWAGIPYDAWTTLTQFSVGQYMKNSADQFFICTTGGLSGAVEPTASGTDGTVVWELLDTSAWAANTAYSFGDYVTETVAAVLRLYMNVALLAAETVSGTNAPCWYYQNGAWKIVDNGVTWQFIDSEYTDRHDGDFCLFDPDLMIEGIRWAYFRAKKMDYQQEREDWDLAVKSAFARFNGPTRVSMADDFNEFFELWPNVPIGSWPVDFG